MDPITAYVLATVRQRELQADADRHRRARALRRPRLRRPRSGARRIALIG